MLCTSMVLRRFLAFGGWGHYPGLLRHRAAGISGSSGCKIWGEPCSQGRDPLLEASSCSEGESEGQIVLLGLWATGQRGCLQGSQCEIESWQYACGVRPHLPPLTPVLLRLGASLLMSANFLLRGKNLQTAPALDRWRPVLYTKSELICWIQSQASERGSGGLRIQPVLSLLSIVCSADVAGQSSCGLLCRVWEEEQQRQSSR